MTCQHLFQTFFNFFSRAAYHALNSGIIPAMKNLITIVAALVLCGGAAAAEQLRLKYAATVTVLDADGKPCGKRTLKAGTLIEVVTPTATAATTTAHSGRWTDRELDADDISPAMFKAEKRTTPTSFFCKIKLDPDPYVPGELEETAKECFCLYVTAFGKGSNASGNFFVFFKKNTPMGKAIIKYVQDGNHHPATLTFHCLPDTSFPDYVILDNIAIKQHADLDRKLRKD